MSTIQKSQTPIIGEIQQTKYIQLSDVEHAKQRAAMYIGSIQPTLQDVYIVENGKICLKRIMISDGVMKLFDELLVNVRDHSTKDPTMNTVKVTFNKKVFSIYNNGKNGINVVIDKAKKIYVPEFIFGNLRTSDNYGERKFVGGMNGLGAKLTNLFSKAFSVTVVDKEGRRFYQKFTEGMSKKTVPKITIVKDEPSVKISCIVNEKEFSDPKNKKYSVNLLDPNLSAALERRVYDICACLPSYVSVSYNDKKINISSFRDYVSLYYPTKREIIYGKCGENWEVGIVVDQEDQKQISFVNGIYASSGSHINHVRTNLVKKVVEKLKEMKKFKKMTINSKTISNILSLFINCQILAPEFDSQTKENLKTHVRNFGSRCEFTDEFIQAVANNKVIHEALVNASQFAELSALKKTESSSRKRIFVKKLIDSKYAGKGKSSQCTLFLVEGDSAKGFAVNGIDVQPNKEYFGVYPLKGKVLNVRKAALSKQAKNKEITELKEILGIKTGKNMTLKDLRYGRVIILTDEDLDGYHIKGLLINLFETFLPTILQKEKFLGTLKTPIIKVWKKTDKKKNDCISFYAVQEYNKWKSTVDLKKWNIKYYKGLATSDKREAIECFTDLEKKITYFNWEKIVEEEKKKEENDTIVVSKKRKTKIDPLVGCRDITSPSYRSIKKAFSEDDADERKYWMAKYKKDEILDRDQTEVGYSEFFDKTYIHYSIYDTERSVPSIMDGMKPSQRKILWAAFLKKLFNQEIKVSQFAGYVSEKTSYHHGEDNISGTIVRMANNYVGTNNITLFNGIGQYGTRLDGGESAGQPRYIKTQLNSLTKYIFREEDFSTYNYVEDDGQIVEPEYYLPIIPMVLVNKTLGIGTGYSSNIPNYNPIKIVENIKRIMNNQNPFVMKPWYFGFSNNTGIKEYKDPKNKTGTRRFICRGLYEKIDDKIITITELPVTINSMENYKEYLESITAKNSKDPEDEDILEDYEMDCNTVRVRFVLYFLPGKMQKLIRENSLEKKLRLYSFINTSNMHLFDKNKQIKKYATTGDILKDFYDERLEQYRKRKEYYSKILENDINLIENKLRYITSYFEGKIKFKNGKNPIPESVQVKTLVSLKFPKMKQNIFDTKTDESYEYLLGMKISSLSEENVKKLKKLQEEKRKIFDDYKNKTEKQLWIEELDQFLVAYKKWYKKEIDEIEKLKTMKVKSSARVKK